MAIKLRGPMVVPHYKITAYVPGFNYFTLAATGGTRLPLVSAVSQIDAPLAALPTMFAILNGSGLEYFGDTPIYSTPTWPAQGFPITTPYRGVVLMVPRFLGVNFDAAATWDVAAFQSALIAELGSDLASNSIWMAYFKNAGIGGAGANELQIPRVNLPTDGYAEITGSRSENLGGDSGVVSDVWDLLIPTNTPAKWTGHEVLYIWVNFLGVAYHEMYVSQLTDKHFNSGLAKYDHYFGSTSRIEAAITQAKETMANIFQGGIFSRSAGHAVNIDSINWTNVVTNADYTAGCKTEAVAVFQAGSALVKTVNQEILDFAGCTYESISYISDTASDYLSAVVAAVAAKVRDFYSL